MTLRVKMGQTLQASSRCKITAYNKKSYIIIMINLKSFRCIQRILRGYRIKCLSGWDSNCNNNKM